MQMHTKTSKSYRPAHEPKEPRVLMTVAKAKSLNKLVIVKR